MIYLIGSLANPKVPQLAQRLRDNGFDTFDQWHAAGPEADKFWQEYFKARNMSFRDALKQDFPQTAFKFDDSHIDSSDTVVMVMPCGKSGHLEFGIAVGSGKRGYILLDGEPDKWDLMYAYAFRNGGGILYNVEELLQALTRDRMQKESYAGTC